MFIFFYLLLTIAIEGTLLAILMQRIHVQTQFIFILSNMCSWSILHVLWYLYGFNIWGLECGAAIFEALALFYVAQIAYRKAFKFAFLTNSASLGIGILILGLPQ